MSLPRRLASARLLQPLRHRDYALLVGGSVVSLFGDGFFFLALTWQVYAISNVPTALAFVGVAGTVPMVLFLLIAGALSDRYDRRKLLISADLVRAAAIGAMAVLSATGLIQLWHIAVLYAFVGLGNAFFNPASSSIVPELVPNEQLPAANAFAGMYRPFIARMVGPAVAGIVVAVAGPPLAFAIDAASFLVSAAAVFAIRARPMRRPVAGHGIRQTLTEVRDGLRYVRSVPWIWATLLAAMFSLLVFMGPMEVLVPYLIKNRLLLGPDSLGLIFAAGGIGSIVASVATGVLGMPARRVTVMYAAWTLGVALIAAFGVMTALWQALLICFALQAMFQVGTIIWETMLQQLVPRNLLGRVSSLDWLVSTGLVPVSFLLTGPVAAVFGPEATIIGGGLLGAALMGMLLLLPGVRDPDRGMVAPPVGEPA
ncbi:MAG TPA: MFS transporter [Candidatus Dormibacteraeota bacterium]|nr:MFS transporter [Candidatus Dormibacteraeota bacterium]